MPKDVRLQVSEEQHEWLKTNGEGQDRASLPQAVRVRCSSDTDGSGDLAVEPNNECLR
jgi:hypothetical protein